MVMMVPFRWVAVRLSGVRLHLRQRSVNHGTEVYNERVLQVRLLGGVAADHDGEQLSLLPPVSRLLAVLALRPGPQDRETVASILWPGAAGAAAARANLRTAIWALRKAVGDDALITSRTAVGLRPEAVTVDLADGLRRAADGDADAAAALCRGELLPRYAEDWAETARRRQRAELAEAPAARSAECTRLRAPGRAPRAGRGRWVLITGEAGMGKPRLVAELARRAENAGARTAIGAGVDVGGAAPLATWQELVPQLARGVPAPP